MPSLLQSAQPLANFVPGRDPHAAHAHSPGDLEPRQGAANPSVIFIRSERYTRLQETLTLQQTPDAGAAQQVATLDQAAEARSTRTASTILSFVGSQLQRDVQDGATEAELASRIEAGLEGFRKGFGDAYAQLEDMGLMNDALAAELQLTYDKVLEGFGQLRKDYLTTETTNADQAPVETAAAPVGENLYFRHEAAESRSFRFSLTTADGDRVQIDVSSLRAGFLEGFAAQAEGLQDLLAFTRGEAAEDKFHMSVKGELDAGELKAINELLSQMNDLAETFYAGNLDAAFEAAGELRFDSSEISAFSLNLSQTRVQRATEVYQQVADQGQGRHDHGRAFRAPSLGGFVQSVEQALQNANRLRQGSELLTGLAQWFESASETRFQNRLQQVIESLQKTA